MRNDRCKLYNLVMSLSGCEKDIPEAVLYGCIMLNSHINVKTMEYLCADFGLRSPAQIAMGYKNILSMISKYEISESNVIKGVPLLLPVLEDIYIPVDSYISKIEGYGEDTVLDRLFEDAIGAVSDRNLKLFKNSGSIGDTNEILADIAADQAIHMLAEMNLGLKTMSHQDNY